MDYSLLRAMIKATQGLELTELEYGSLCEAFCQTFTDLEMATRLNNIILEKEDAVSGT